MQFMDTIWVATISMLQQKEKPTKNWYIKSDIISFSLNKLISSKLAFSVVGLYFIISLNNR